MTNPTSILDSYFDAQTMSVHLQQNQPAVMKKWKPGGWMMHTSDHISQRAELETLVDTIYQEVEARDDAFIEIQRSASTVIQLGRYRIVIVKPPVSSAMELTIVRPIAKLSLPDYQLDETTKHRLLHDAKGILIAGAPGEGKTTFAQALIEEKAKQEIIIKTIESPRDLVVPGNVTQYSFSHAPHNEIRDILLLSRPDRTVYDEIRNKEDFVLYKDLRLTGIGLIGVMHATQAIDSLQRFISAIDMGSLPQVIDTVVFIKAGRVHQILALEQVVKIPAGMESADLARPVIFVKAFPHETVLYEIYTYSDNVVVMPMDQVEAMEEERSQGIKQYAKKQLEQEIRSLLGIKVSVEVTGMQSILLYVPESEKARVIGRQWSNIEELQRKLDLHISVKTADEDETPAYKAYEKPKWWRWKAKWKRGRSY